MKPKRFETFITKDGEDMISLGQFTTYEEAVQTMYNSLSDIYIYPTKTGDMLPKPHEHTFIYPGRTYNIKRIKGV